MRADCRDTGWETHTNPVPSGRPANFSGASDALHRASSNCSADSILVTACEKYFVSSLFDGVARALSW